ncbi:MAG: YtxH domain-containing protein [Anaerolineae bacterium]
MGNVLRLLGGLVIGAAIGAGAGLLLTPKSGADIQGMVRGHVNNAVEAGKAAQVAKQQELEQQAGIKRP